MDDNLIKSAKEYSVKTGKSVSRIVADLFEIINSGHLENMNNWYRAGGRAIFARGAVRAALWAYTQKPGLYSMRDVLGLVE